MRVTKISIAGALLGLSFVAACRGSDSPPATPDAPVVPGDTAGDTGDGTFHIQDVQNIAMAVGTAVELHGVIVTAVDGFGARTGDLFVEEAGGGPFSGVHVFGAPAAQLAGLTVGDIVDIRGAVKNEFALNGSNKDKSGRTTTELQAPKRGALTVTKKGTGVVPAPYVLDANALDAMAAADRDAEYEKWEGVLIQVANVRTRSYPTGFGSVTPIPDDSYKLEVTANLLLTSAQTKFVGIDGLTCFATVTGVEDYFYDWLLLPRNAADVVVGTACAPVATTTAAIKDVQATLPTGIVEMGSVYVTGVSFNRRSIWIASSPTAAPTESVLVFQSTIFLPVDPAIVPGVKVSVTGTVSELNDDTTFGSLTEVTPLRITIVDPTPVALTPVTELPVGTPLTAATLLDPANALPFESVLVTLANVKITAVGTSANGGIATATQGVTTFGIGTDILQLKDAAPTSDLACYKTVTGFWTNLEAADATIKPNAFGFIVRDLGTKDGTCI